MTKPIDKLSVFFPAYNEEKNLAATVENALHVLEKTANEWEIIIVDDGSSDGTLRVAERLAEENKGISVISHKVNRGYGAALKSGIYGSKYMWIAFTDADGQFDFSEISKLIEKQKETGADMVAGYYLHRKVSAIRKLNSFAWQTLVFLLFGLKMSDIDCGFKLFSRKIFDTIPKLESERGAFITSEYLIKAQNYGFKIVEIGVNHYPRLHGVATGASLKVIVKSFVDLGKLWFKLRRKVVPKSTAN